MPLTKCDSLCLHYPNLVSKRDKSWPSLINYDPSITKIYSFTKNHKPDIPLRPIPSGIGSAHHPPHVKLLAKTLSPLLGTISNAYINNSGSLLELIKYEK